MRGAMALSAFAHAAALSIAAFGLPSPFGAEATGGGGAAGVAAVTLVGGESAVAALVAEWERQSDTGRPPQRQPAALAVDATQPPQATAAATAPAVRHPAPTHPPPSAPPQSATPVASAAEPAVPRPRARPAGHDVVETRAPSTQHSPGPRKADPPAREAEPTLRAAGARTAATAGAGPPTSATSGDGTAAARAVQTWAAEVQRALQRGLSGASGPQRGAATVVLALSVAPDGTLRTASVARTSGDPGLDAAALRGVRRLGRLPQAPDGLTAVAYAFQAPLVYRER